MLCYIFFYKPGTPHCSVLIFKNCVVQFCNTVLKIFVCKFPFQVTSGVDFTLSVEY